LKATVTVNLQKLQQMLPNLQAAFRSVAGPPLLEAILDLMSKGISPVKGVGRLVEYSETYKRMIMGEDSLSIESEFLQSAGKGIRPVNLFVTGTMYKSGKTDETNNGVRVSFTDALADIHNTQGAGKSKVVRHFMPTVPGEAYSKVIMDKMLGITAEIIQKEVDSQNS